MIATVFLIGSGKPRPGRLEGDPGAAALSCLCLKQLARLPIEGGTMNRSKLKAQRLVVLFAVGGLLFNYPLLALFNRPVTVIGIPLLYIYVYAAWVLLIALLALVIERK
jgi:hypothetical protein